MGSLPPSFPVVCLSVCLTPRPLLRQRLILAEGKMLRERLGEEKERFLGSPHGSCVRHSHLLALTF